MMTEAEINKEVTQPRPHAIRGQLVFKGTPKRYNMGYLEGFPHVYVDVYKGEGVTVTYVMTGLVFSWDWKYKEEAWSWARDKEFHIGAIKASGNEYARRIH